MELLQQHEGEVLKPYYCPAGALTVGYGRNLDAKGISQDEALYLLSNDIDECMTDLQEFDWWYQLDPARQSAMIDMRYNLGATGFRKFRKMLNCMSMKDYHGAAREMLDSKAARGELPDGSTARGLVVRYTVLANILRNGC